MYSVVNLKEARDKQELKKKEQLIIPADLIDVVDYAQIERDHAEFLRIMIETTPYILKTQYRQFYGKSRTYVNELLRFLEERNIVGRSTYRGLIYYYPLKKALSWYYGIKDVKGYRRNVSERFLLESFCRAEFILMRDTDYSFIYDLKSYLTNFDYPDINVRYYPSSDRLQLERIASFSKEKLSSFVHKTVSFLKNSIHILYFDVNKEAVTVDAYIVHYEGMDFVHYNRNLKSLYDFTGVFDVDVKNVRLFVLRERGTEKEDIKKYLSNAKQNVIRDQGKSIASGQLLNKNKQTNFGFYIIILNLSRYYQKEYLDQDFLSGDNSEMLERVLIPE